MSNAELIFWIIATIAIILYAAYIAAIIDIWYLKRQARKHNEVQQLLHRLTRRYD